MGVMVAGVAGLALALLGAVPLVVLTAHRWRRKARPESPPVEREARSLARLHLATWIVLGLGFLTLFGPWDRGRPFNPHSVEVGFENPYGIAYVVVVAMIGLVLLVLDRREHPVQRGAVLVAGAGVGAMLPLACILDGVDAMPGAVLAAGAMLVLATLGGVQLALASRDRAA